MKTLLILRHAKSSWSHLGTADHDRPLTKRGTRDAPRIGRLIKQQGLTPGLILSSTARRAKKTAETVAEHCEYPGQIEFLSNLYLASPEMYLKVLSELADDIDCVLVVGHNPGLEDLLEILTEAGETLTTAALAQVNLSITQWHELNASTSGTLVKLWRPRELPSS